MRLRNFSNVPQRPGFRLIPNTFTGFTGCTCCDHVLDRVLERVTRDLPAGLPVTCHRLTWLFFLGSVVTHQPMRLPFRHTDPSPTAASSSRSSWLQDLTPLSLPTSSYPLQLCRHPHPRHSLCSRLGHTVVLFFIARWRLCLPQTQLVL